MTLDIKAKTLVHTIDPENPTGTPTLAFIVRQATREDKEAFLARMKSQLGSGETIDDASLEAVYNSPDIFLCIEKDELTLVSRDNIRAIPVEDMPQSA